MVNSKKKKKDPSYSDWNTAKTEAEKSRDLNINKVVCRLYFYLNLCHRSMETVGSYLQECNEEKESIGCPPEL